jgi:hypothetical protein
VAEKFQEGREGKYRAGIRKNGFQWMIQYLTHTRKIHGSTTNRSSL